VIIAIVTIAGEPDVDHLTFGGLTFTFCNKEWTDATPKSVMGPDVCPQCHDWAQERAIQHLEIANLVTVRGGLDWGALKRLARVA